MRGPMRIDPTDAVGGGLMIGLGAAASVISLGYPMGNLARIGPGAFPLALGVILMLLGAGIILGALGRSGALPRPNWRAGATVLAALVAFAVLIDRFGLVPATIACVLVARLADGRFRLGPVLVLAAILAALCWGIFVLGLNLPIPVLEFGL